MKITKLGWKALGRLNRLFVIWINTIIVLTATFSGVFGHYWSLGVSSFSLIVWNVIILATTYRLGAIEIDLRAQSLSSSNGHTKRSVIVFLNEKKDNDQSS